MIRLFSLPPELVIAIFKAFALSRSFKRFMRLRLVCRNFKFFVEDVILSNPLPQAMLECMKRDKDNHSLHPLHLKVLVRQAAMARETIGIFGRIRHTAVTLCEMAGDTGQDALMETLTSLCNLFFDSGVYWYITDPFDKVLAPEPEIPSPEDLDADLCVAAVYLGRRAHVEHLISQGLKFCIWGTNRVEEWSSVFDCPFHAATFRGDVSMIRLLLSSNPRYNPSKAVPLHLRTVIITNAARFGHKDAFDFAIDIGPLGVGRDNNEIGNYDPCGLKPEEFDFIRDGVEETSIVDNYRRGKAILGFVDDSMALRKYRKLSERISRGDTDIVRYLLTSGAPTRSEMSISRISEQLREATRNGKPDMVALLLEQGVKPDDSHRVHKPLMIAAWNSSISIASLLLEAGAQPDCGQPPPIVLAIAKEDMEMFRLLRKYGARLDTPETGGWAMAVAQFWEYESMIDLLVENGVERDAVLHRCPERQEVAKISWHLFLQQKDIDGDTLLNHVLNYEGIYGV
ncbi:ankyrin repeat-containing domain protein [Nemania sp. FL0916]|nr:ankyrin repeat-containing domain protein [Nemania sp. FL0916]